MNNLIGKIQPYVLICILGLLVYNFLGSNDNSLIKSYKKEIEKHEIVIKSFKDSIKYSRDSIKYLDIKLKQSNIRNTINERKVRTIKYKYNEIIKKIRKNDVSYSFTIVSKHLDSVRAKNKKVN